MTTSLLLVTADTRLTKTLFQSIEHEGYRLHIAKGKGEAVVKLNEENCSLALLDLDLGERPISDIGRALRTINPTIKLILFSDADTPPALDERFPTNCNRPGSDSTRWNRSPPYRAGRRARRRKSARGACRQ